MEHEVTRNLFANIKATGFPDKREEMSLVIVAVTLIISSLIRCLTPECETGELKLPYSLTEGSG